METNKLAILLISLTLVTACGGSDNSSDNELSGIWRSELNNTLYLILQSGNDISINVCNEDAPFTISKEGEFIGEQGNYLFEIVNSSQLKFSTGVHDILQGVNVNKISDGTAFNFGSISISSSNITDLSTSLNVCAYRETDNTHNHIAAPYLDGYMLINLDIDNESIGDFTIFDNSNIDIQSDQLDSGEIDALSGGVIVTAYTADRLEASFTFTARDGNEYSGAINVSM